MLKNRSEQSRDTNKPNPHMALRPESKPGHIGSRQVRSPIWAATLCESHAAEVARCVFA